jgi:hypothetical protein
MSWTAGFTPNIPQQTPSIMSSMSNMYFGNTVDQRLFENAQQQLRQGVDIAMISNLFQSPAIPAGNTEFAFSPSISIPIARTMLNSNPTAANPGPLSLNSAAMESNRQGMDPLLSAVALLQRSQGMLDPFGSQHQALWSTQARQQSVEQAVQSALANVRWQEQMEMQHASLTHEFLQRLNASKEQSAASANFNETIAFQAKPKKPASSKKPKYGILLGITEDRCKLNDQQVFLRQQIEAYRATEDDLTSHTRGRNKPVVLGQVGIRCIHCSHLPASHRGKGSTYFPSTLMGIYQAAQNMSVEHLQSGICTEMPPDVRSTFLTFGLTKPGASVAGKRYWAEAGKRIGLVDTEHGIRFAKDKGKPVEMANSSAPSTNATMEE